MEVKKWSKQKKNDQYAIVKRKDPENTAGIKLGKKIFVGGSVEEDSSNEEAGEYEEEIYAKKPVIEYVSKETDQRSSSLDVRFKAMRKNHHEDSHSSDTVERAKMTLAGVSYAR